MIEALCGSKNIKRILLFLFVNGKCYGSQIQRLLKSSLTPIQKALIRLEKGGIILSYYEGKTRVYQFNPAYPILAELEMLLKKTYTLLPSQEKKLYSIVNPETSFKADKRSENARILLAFWERLNYVKELSFHAKTNSKGPGGWNGKGKGEVHVAKNSDNELVFTEKGTWKGENNRETVFSNIFRWTLDTSAGIISLEHLRRGLNNPVLLFHLVPSGNQSLTSIDSHLCGGDTYFGQIFYDHNSLRLNWKVIGPKKNEELDYYYS